MSNVKIKTKQITKLGFEYIESFEFKAGPGNSRLFKNINNGNLINIWEDCKFIDLKTEIKYRYSVSIWLKQEDITYHKDFHKASDMYKYIKNNIRLCQ